MTKNMLIAYLYCNLGGVTSVIKQRMPVYRSSNWNVKAYFKQDVGGLFDLAQLSNIEVGIYNDRFCEKIVEDIQKGQFDACTIIDTPELISAIRKVSNIPIVYEIHTSIERVIVKNSISDLYKCNVILVPSVWSKSNVLRIFPNFDGANIVVQSNIVDEKIFNSDGEMYDLKNPTLLWVGKHNSEFKNPDEALLVAMQFLEQHPDWQFINVSGGTVDKDYAAHMLGIVDEHQLTNRFTWLHNLSQRAMGMLYRGVAKSNGFLISTSLAESFCLVIHEAMRCGVPIISTDLGAVAELIVNEVNGLIYNTGDISSVLEKAEKLLDKNYREKIINQGFIDLKMYNQEILQGKYAGILKKIS